MTERAKQLAQRRLADKDLVVNFFMLFVRMEYSLKRTGTYLAGDLKEAKANWDKFGKDHDSIFNLSKSSELTSAVKYLKCEPPQRQIVKDGKLDWCDVKEPKGPTLQMLLHAVRRVRNNLFHGGKFPEKPVENPARNTTLMRSCVVILDECLKLNHEVRCYFEED